jgi:hypothetical protein
MTSPRLMPTRNSIRSLGGSPRSRSAIPRWKGEGAADGVHHAGEFGEEAVAGVLDDPAVAAGGRRARPVRGGESRDGDACPPRRSTSAWSSPRHPRREPRPAAVRSPGRMLGAGTRRSRRGRRARPKTPSHLPACPRRRAGSRASVRCVGSRHPPGPAPGGFPRRTGKCCRR